MTSTRLKKSIIDQFYCYLVRHFFFLVTSPCRDDSLMLAWRMKMMIQTGAVTYPKIRDWQFASRFDLRRIEFSIVFFFVISFFFFSSRISRVNNLCMTDETRVRIVSLVVPTVLSVNLKRERNVIYATARVRIALVPFPVYVPSSSWVKFSMNDKHTHNTRWMTRRMKKCYHSVYHSHGTI